MDSLISHIQTQAANQPGIPFVIRRVQAVPDQLSDNTYVFFVPDEGYDEVARLHDKFYTGVLAAELRADIPFIPHITLGYAHDSAYCQQVADEINARPFELRGSIDVLDVVQLEGHVGKTVAQIAFQ